MPNLHPTDSASANVANIQEAINAQLREIHPEPIYLAPGEWKINKEINLFAKGESINEGLVEADGLMISGDRKLSVVLKWVDNADLNHQEELSVFRFKGDCRNYQLTDMLIDGGKTIGHAIKGKVITSLFRDLHCRFTVTAAADISMWSNRFVRCMFNNNLGHGLRLGPQSNNVIVQACGMKANAGFGIRCESSFQIAITGTDISNNMKAGLYAFNIFALTMQSCYLENNGTIKVGPETTPDKGFNFLPGTGESGTGQIERKDSGSWIKDGFIVGQTVTVHDAGFQSNNGTYTILVVEDSMLYLENNSFRSSVDDNRVHFSTPGLSPTGFNDELVPIKADVVLTGSNDESKILSKFAGNFAGTKGAVFTGNIHYQNTPNVACCYYLIAVHGAVIKGNSATNCDALVRAYWCKEDNKNALTSYKDIDISNNAFTFRLGPIARPNGFVFGSGGGTGGNDEIKRTDGGSWISDGISAGDTITVSKANILENNGSYTIRKVVSEGMLEVASGSFTDSDNDATAKFHFSKASQPLQISTPIYDTPTDIFTDTYINDPNFNVHGNGNSCQLYGENFAGGFSSWTVYPGTGSNGTFTLDYGKKFGVHEVYELAGSTYSLRVWEFGLDPASLDNLKGKLVEYGMWYKHSGDVSLCMGFNMSGPLRYETEFNQSNTFGRWVYRSMVFRVDANAKYLRIVLTKRSPNLSSKNSIWVSKPFLCELGTSKFAVHS